MSNSQTLKQMNFSFGKLNITASVEKRLASIGYSVDSLEAAIDYHKTSSDGQPAIYCGSWGKYNNGSLRGMWINIASFNDFGEFINFCKAIHSDEYDPEFMDQDYEGIPTSLINKNVFTPEGFEAIKLYCSMCSQYGAEAVNDYMEINDDLEYFEENFCGIYDSEEDFARSIAEETLDLENKMGDLSIYFDYEAFARDLFLFDYYMGSNGHVFRRY